MDPEQILDLFFLNRISVFPRRLKNLQTVIETRKRDYERLRIYYKCIRDFQVLFTRKSKKKCVKDDSES